MWHIKDIHIALEHCKNHLKTYIQLKDINKKVNEKIKQCKHEYKEKLERQFQSNNTQAAWECMNKIVGRGSKKEYVFEEDAHTHVNELNSFYFRFHVHDFKEEINTIKTSLNHKEDEAIFRLVKKRWKNLLIG